MPTPIEMMIDKACGHKAGDIPEKVDPAKVLLNLADASEAWYRNESAKNFEAMKVAIKAWIDVAC